MTAQAIPSGVDDPKEVISRAIAAFGGDAARTKLRTCRLTTRCVATIPAAKMNDTVLMEDSFCYPDKWRRIVRRESDNKEAFRFVINGNKNWAKFVGNKVQEMPMPPANMRKPAIIATLDQLTSLQESPQEIIIGADQEVAGKTLIPLTVTSAICQSTTYFDRSTGLIVKETKNHLPDLRGSPEALKKGSPVESETTYSDYKNFDGVMLSTRMVASQAGVTVLDVSVLQVEFPSAFDANAFDKLTDD